MGKNNKSKDFFHIILNKSKKEKITIVVLVGILLLVIVLPLDSSKNKTNNASSSNTYQSTPSSNNNDYENKLENKLEDILSKVDGVGKVRVVVSLKATGEKVIATDKSFSTENSQETDSSGGTRDQNNSSNTSTSIYRDTSDGSEPYVTMENMPAVEGIIIVAEGGGSGTVASNITSAVEALLNVPAHKIKVLKMS